MTTAGCIYGRNAMPCAAANLVIQSNVLSPVIAAAARCRMLLSRFIPLITSVR